MNMQKKVSQTREKLSQIIQDIVINIPKDSFYYMPNNEALRKQISCIQLKNLPSQLQSLEEINIPIQLQVTMRGE
ncbi:8106_t:CDS:2 [Scutellospora calospora]|uniref:8106_t:CDS:1 n=1 Tax=Scutellospora calospora TaxID=85575 RepID=A0ACA9KHE9_9GLOM|nr:8106_t:CDS:2 [Scutellospora calospora]